MFPIDTIHFVPLSEENEGEYSYTLPESSEVVTERIFSIITAITDTFQEYPRDELDDTPSIFTSMYDYILSILPETSTVPIPVYGTSHQSLQPDS